MADAKNITATIGGVDLSPFTMSVQVSVDEITWEDLTQFAAKIPRAYSAGFSVEGDWIGRLIGEPWPYAHIEAWHGYLSRAANPDDAPAPEIVRRTHRIERAYARLARAPKLDWWGK